MSSDSHTFLTAGQLEYWKTLHAVEARRLRCQHCKRAYNYLVGENVMADSAGSPGERDRAAARIEASLLKQLHRAANRRQRGAAPCPHCHCYQTWMVAASVRREVLIATPLGAVVCGALVLAARSAGADVSLSLLIVALVVGGIVGALAGRLRALRIGPHPNLRSPLVASDEDMTKRLREAGQPESGSLSDDAILDWYAAARPETVGMGMPLFMGWQIMDDAGKRRLPNAPSDPANPLAASFAEPQTAARLAALKRDGIVRRRREDATASAS